MATFKQNLIRWFKNNKWLGIPSDDRQGLEDIINTHDVKIVRSCDKYPHPSMYDSYETLLNTMCLKARAYEKENLGDRDILIILPQGEYTEGFDTLTRYLDKHSFIWESGPLFSTLTPWKNDTYRRIQGLVLQQENGRLVGSGHEPNSDFHKAKRHCTINEFIELYDKYCKIMDEHADEIFKTLA